MGHRVTIVGIKMARYSHVDWGLLLLRLGFAVLLVGLHGWTRLVRAFNLVVYGTAWTFVGLVERLGFPFPSLFAVPPRCRNRWRSFVALGLFARPAAAIIAFNMAVAFYNEAGKGDPYEVPGLYLLIALVLLVAGPGRLALPWPRRRPQNVNAAFFFEFLCIEARHLAERGEIRERSFLGPSLRQENIRFLGGEAGDEHQVVLVFPVDVDPAAIAQQIVLNRAVVVVGDLRARW